MQDGNRRRPGRPSKGKPRMSKRQMKDLDAARKRLARLNLTEAEKAAEREKNRQRQALRQQTPEEQNRHRLYMRRRRQDNGFLQYDRNYHRQRRSDAGYRAQERIRDRDARRLKAGIQTEADYHAELGQDRKTCSCCLRTTLARALTKYTLEYLKRVKNLSDEFIDSSFPEQYRIENGQAVQLCHTCKEYVLKKQLPEFCSNTCRQQDLPEAIRALSREEEEMLAIELPLGRIVQSADRQQQQQPALPPSASQPTEGSHHNEIIHLGGTVPTWTNVFPRPPDQLPFIDVQSATGRPVVGISNESKRKLRSAFNILKDTTLYRNLQPQYNEEQFDQAVARMQQHPPQNPLPETATVEAQAEDEDSNWPLTADHFNPLHTETLILDQTDAVPALCDSKEYAGSSDDDDDSQQEVVPPASVPFGRLDELSEYHRFPKTYAGEPMIVYCPLVRDNQGNRIENDQANYQKRSSWELQRVNSRALSAEQILLKYAILTYKKLEKAVNICLRQFPERRRVTARDVLNKRNLGRLLRKNKGYEMMRRFRNAPAYWEGKKKDVKAMIRQLGPPTFFLTLSQAQTEWPELLATLSRLLDGRELSLEAAAALTVEQKIALLKRHPVLVAQFFNQKINAIFSLMTHGTDDSPFKDGAKLDDHYIRFEFGSLTGAPHVHCLLWVKGEKVPQLDHLNSQEATDQLIEFVDQHITCSRGRDAAERELVGKFQRHQHSQSCKKVKSGEQQEAYCRFSLPAPPMPRTMLLHPLPEAECTTVVQDTAKNIKRRLKELSQRPVGDLQREMPSFEELLADMWPLTEAEYIEAIRSTLKRSKIFLRRSPAEMLVNAYNPSILRLHQANMDMQYVLDPYACTSYIFKAADKAFSRGLTPLLKRLVSSARRCSTGPTYRALLNAVASQFFHARQVSVQEAVYYILGLPVSLSSRVVEFINTGLPKNRDRVLLPQAKLRQLPPDSTDIYQRSNLNYYELRGAENQSVCLATLVAESRVYLGPQTAAAAAAAAAAPDNNNNAGGDGAEEGNDGNDANADAGNDADADAGNDSAAESDDDDDEGAAGAAIPPNNTEHPHFPSCPINDIPGAAHVVRKKEKIIRWRNYSEDFDPENFLRVQLMLYFPYRNEEVELLQLTYDQLRELYTDNFDTIERNRSLFTRETNRQIARKALQNGRAGWNPIHPIDIGDAFVPYPHNRPQVPAAVGAEEEEAVEMEVDGADNVRQRMPERTPGYCERLAMLSDEQRKLVLEILHLVQKGTLQFGIFISGGAGTGKTFFIETLRKVLNFCLRQLAVLHSTDAFASDDFVLVCAPTGRAAFNVGGSTIHSTFRLKVVKSQEKRGRSHLASKISNPHLPQLDDSTLATVRAEHRNAEVLILDEGSMVSSSLLADINIRTNQIAGYPADEVFFGGLSVIVVGDLAQLSPVDDSWIFQPQGIRTTNLPEGHNNSNHLAVLADTHIWSKFKFVELKISQRHLGDTALANALENLRSGNPLSPESIELFRSCEWSPVSQQQRPMPSDTLHIFRSNSEVDNFNRNALAELRRNALEADDNVYHQSVAIDRCRGTSYLTNEQLNSELAEVAGMHVTETGGLPTTLQLVVGARYMLTANVHIEDGLVNGAMGRLQRFDIIEPEHQPRRVYILWLLFDRLEVGQQARAKYSEYMAEQGIPTTWTPIEMDARKIKELHRGRSALFFTRQHFSVMPAEAVTIYKAQGGTFPNVAFHVPRDCTMEEVYVACSRATTANGLFILDRPFPVNISVPPNDPVRLEYERLRLEENRMPMELYDWDNLEAHRGGQYLKLVYHNVFGLRQTFASTMADQAFRKSHLLMLSGTEEDGQQTELDWEGHNFEKLDRSQINAMAGQGGTLAAVHQDFTGQCSVFYKSSHTHENGGRLEMLCVKVLLENSEAQEIYVLSISCQGLFPVEDFINRVQTFFNQLHIFFAPHLIVVGDIDNNPDSTLNDDEVDQDKLQKLEVFFVENNLVDKIPEDGRPAFSNIDLYHSGIVYARKHEMVNVHVYPSATSPHDPLLVDLHMPLDSDDDIEME